MKVMTGGEDGLLVERFLQPPGKSRQSASVQETPTFPARGDIFRAVAPLRTIFSAIDIVHSPRFAIECTSYYTSEPQAKSGRVSAEAASQITSPG